MSALFSTIAIGAVAAAAGWGVSWLLQRSIVRRRCTVRRCQVCGWRLPPAWRYAVCYRHAILLDALAQAPRAVTWRMQPPPATDPSALDIFLRAVPALGEPWDDTAPPTERN